MRDKITPWIFTLGLGMSAMLTPIAASAANFDGATNVVCAAIDIVGCTDGSNCLQGQARDFDLPQFIVVDIEKKALRATKESGQDEVSPIKNHEVTDKQVIMQGIENHHGWSVTIDRETGAMKVSIAGQDVSFMMFGACTAL